VAITSNLLRCANRNDAPGWGVCTGHPKEDHMTVKTTIALAAAVLIGTSV